MGSCLTHAQHFHHGIHHIVLKELKGISGLYPGCAVFLFKDTAELFGLAFFINELLQFGALQILTVKAQIVIKHLGKYAEDCRVVLINGALDINIKEDSICLTADCAGNLHEGSLIVKLLPEIILHALSVHFLILQKVGKHLQEMRFTTSKETGDPHAHICRMLPEGLPVVIKEGDHMLPDIPGDDILLHFLLQDLCRILIDLDDAVDLTVNVVIEHLLYFHRASPYNTFFSDSSTPIMLKAL